MRYNPHRSSFDANIPLSFELQNFQAQLFYQIKSTYRSILHEIYHPEIMIRPNELSIFATGQFLHNLNVLP